MQSKMHMLYYVEPTNGGWGPDPLQLHDIQQALDEISATYS